jgi:uncharacterized membrane protein
MKKTTITALIASIIGFIDSAYLAIIKLINAPIYCTPGLGDCASVQNSQWSTILGIPIAVLGALAYLALIGCYLFESKNAFIGRNSTYILFGISFFGFIYSMFLTWLELFVIHAICQWCMLSALCMTIIFIATIIRLKNQQVYPNK